MSLKLRDLVGNIFHTEEQEKAAEAQQSAALQQKVGNVFGTSDTNRTRAYNPFLNKNGELFNPNLNYQQLLDNPKISQVAKNYITQATGLSPAVTAKKTIVPSTSESYKAPDNTVQTTQEPATGNTTKKATTPSAPGNTIAEAAQKYIGTPYVWGGESMSEGGMDCSGFVYNALKDAGYSVGRTTAQGYRSYGTSVSKADMLPGDLIFFGKNNNDASHIGIYLGNGKMIHSSGGSKNTASNPGKGVSITNVDYRSDFLEARRY